MTERGWKDDGGGDSRCVLGTTAGVRCQDITTRVLKGNEYGQGIRPVMSEVMNEHRPSFILSS